MIQNTNYKNRIVNTIPTLYSENNIIFERLTYMQMF